MRTILATTIVAASLAIFGGMLPLAIPAMAYPSSDMTTAAGNTTTSAMQAEPKMHGYGSSTADAIRMWTMMHKDMKFGIISSIQNDEQGQPAWVVSGYWIMRNNTGASDTQTTANNPSSGIGEFYSMFYMTRLDGTAAHSHEIYNFTQVGDSTFDSTDNSTTIRGTATVTMREGPVNDVDMTIKISNGHVVAISIDPQPIDNHFGDTPIYGMVITPEMLVQMHMGAGMKMHMNMGMDTGTASMMMGDDSMHGMMCDKWMSNDNNDSTGTAMNGGMPK